MIATSILSPTPESIHRAAVYIQNGDLVAFPTETVYGLGADATSTPAVQKIFSAKNRPADNPLIVHVAHREQIGTYVHITSPLEELLIEKLMPGPLTLELRAREMISPLTSGGGINIGMRVPAHPITKAFLEEANCPIAAPSANRSGRPSPTTAEMVLTDMEGIIPCILDGGPCAYGIESTVAKVINGKVAILRPGFVTQEDLQQIVGGGIEVYFATTHLEESPGTRYKHYAPDAPVHIIEPEHIAAAISKPEHMKNTDQTDQASEKGGKIALIVTTETWSKIDVTTKNKPHVLYMNRGSHANLVTCASRLYQLYYEASKAGVDAIYIEALPEQGLGVSIMNRVKRSAEKE